MHLSVASVASGLLMNHLIGACDLGGSVAHAFSEGAEVSGHCPCPRIGAVKGTELEGSGTEVMKAR